jgi:hypothetical protein
MFCDVATNSDPGLTHFQQKVDALNDFIRSNQVHQRRVSNVHPCVRALCMWRAVAPMDARSTRCSASEPRSVLA